MQLLICVILLCMYTGAVPRTQAVYGQGTGPIFMDNVVCNGQELRLLDCASNALAAHDCTHLQDAGVVCMPMISRKCTSTTCTAYVFSQHGCKQLCCCASGAEISECFHCELTRHSDRSHLNIASFKHVLQLYICLHHNCL